MLLIHSDVQGGGGGEWMPPPQGEGGGEATSAEVFSKFYPKFKFYHQHA